MLGERSMTVSGSGRRKSILLNFKFQVFCRREINGSQDRFEFKALSLRGFNHFFHDGLAVLNV
jgi:hypothetical protein